MGTKILLYTSWTSQYINTFSAVAIPTGAWFCRIWVLFSALSVLQKGGGKTILYLIYSVYIYIYIYTKLVVSSQLKNISQIESFPQVVVEINHVWNHHPNNVLILLWDSWRDTCPALYCTLGRWSSHGYLYDLLVCMKCEGYLKVVYYDTYRTNYVYNMIKSFSVRDEFRLQTNRTQTNNQQFPLKTP